MLALVFTVLFSIYPLFSSSLSRGEYYLYSHKHPRILFFPFPDSPKSSLSFNYQDPKIPHNFFYQIGIK